MFLRIKNTGKISSAEVEIKGITVMAGENNTGKSTVGKVLFCLFNSFYKLEQQIEQERKNMISGIIESVYIELTGRLTRRFDTNEFAELILSKKDSYKDGSDLAIDLQNIFIQTDKAVEKHLNNNVLSNAAERVLTILNVSDDAIFDEVLDKRLQAEFDMQVYNVNNPNLMCEIALKIKKNEVSVSILKDEFIEVKNSFSLNTEVIYLDNPLALDDQRLPVYSSGNHRNHLRAKLLGRSEDSPVKDAIDRIITSKKLDPILEKLNEICKGKLIRKSGVSRFAVAYQEGDSQVALDMRNISTGLKTFVIMKTLLLNGSLEENGIMVLDEPEIHLHPEWQLVFAELIVLLHKEFNMHILINTHSPYFVDAINVYSYKYELSEKCMYYLAEDINGIALITDVSNNIEKIYERLARPLQDLENERYRYD
jgi:predicted ATP-dependent endonuclease of OLD family